MVINRPITYWAGLFDGEGCINIQARGREHQLRVVVGMRDMRLPLQLKKSFGGSNYTQMIASGPFTYWTGIGQTAFDFLSKVLPHLVTKAAEARVAINFFLCVRNNARKPLTVRELARRERYRKRLSALKRS